MINFTRRLKTITNLNREPLRDGRFKSHFEERNEFLETRKSFQGYAARPARKIDIAGNRRHSADKVCWRRLKRIDFLVIIFSCLILASCAGVKNAQQALLTDKSYCNKQQVYRYTKDDLPKPIDQTMLDTSLTNRFSMQSLNVANAIGIFDGLRQFTNLVNDYHLHPTFEKKINLMEYSQQINQKINIASLEISAVASELDCEEERANQFAYYLKEKEDKTENRLIIGTIIIGAAGAISAEAMSNSNAASSLTIAVSLVEATLGALMLVNKKKIEFRHPENPLTDIWNNSIVSSYFPPSIWQYLTYQDPRKNEKSLAQLLVDKWIIFGQVSKEDTNAKNKANKLYFGEGGKYQAGQLKTRADMIDQTESYITLMKQDLMTLAHEIDNLHFK